MRLKTIEGPLAVHNGNNDILNSPKRINTLQNSNTTTTTTLSNITSNYIPVTNLTYDTNNSNDTINNVIKELNSTTDSNIINNGVQDKVQWCQASLQETQNNAKNNTHRILNLVNVNINTLAATLRRRQGASDTPTFLKNAAIKSVSNNSICSQRSSSDDTSYLDYEEAQQSCSSVDTSPQDEDRDFDISDSESSDDGNLSNRGTVQRRCVVNPNYPGFQHLAHTLTSDAEYTDDDLECESLNVEISGDSLTAKLEAEANNNNNIEEIDTDYKIDSVNRLDSVENIQKVFHDKPAFNIEEDSEFNRNSESISGDEDNIVGDFRQEVEEELCKVAFRNEDSYNLRKIEKAVEEKLEEAAEKLQVLKDFSPTAVKYNIQPNIEEPFNKLSPTKVVPLHRVLQDSKVVKGHELAVETEDLPEEDEENKEINEENAKKPAELEFGASEDPLAAKMADTLHIKIEDAFLSNAKENISVQNGGNDVSVDDNLNFRETKMEVDDCSEKKDETIAKTEKEEDNAVPRKKEKVETTTVKKRKDDNQQTGSLIGFARREGGTRSRETMNRRSVPIVREKKKSNAETIGSFDVYNIETAMPKIDLEAIECHLRAAREEERRRRTDREEIRRRLAMGTEDDYYTDRPGRKPSLQARLQSGMNLQICFMNESLSDTDSPSSDSECPMTNPKQNKINNNLSKCPATEKSVQPPTRPATLSISQQVIREPMQELDFFARQARLQTEARMALAQAKEMARMQMEIEKQRQKKSPITEMIRTSMEKVGIPFPEDKRRLSRQILTDMNVAQLQVIVNDLHTQIENLNESLVKFLMTRDDLHMEQDSMLVDIEDLTRYLGAKEQVIKEQIMLPSKNNNTPPSPAPSSPLQSLNSTVKPHLHRIASLVKK
ncbi:general transcriptional corepressor trfA [Diorhabda sublineata]|uniref:general transcriptional corepressor trfA n=1 Tax=Diorhabda sublineata TaxID=1163346 RepID=UPI0024E07467|nr:general transcriptional corepressor trfA [Diorhabda sublineata]XP_056639446.1 general transcriptional corepressor trfA [Diorhabda sublineata]XP_056639447.1 general transcriptional corepressor trfA [Diorhabda sublineata]XP_056639448.1 general transcriptional corepressor trfA [Diorhabda sublineata]